MTSESYRRQHAEYHWRDCITPGCGFQAVRAGHGDIRVSQSPNSACLACPASSSPSHGMGKMSQGDREFIARGQPDAHTQPTLCLVSNEADQESGELASQSRHLHVHFSSPPGHLIVQSKNSHHSESLDTSSLEASQNPQPHGSCLP